MSLYDYLDTSNAEEMLLDRKLTIPQKVINDSDWTIEALQEHLQWAVDIELYTIPFYMSAMYSVKDQASEARRLVRTIVNQEMLHMQSAANIANAYGTNLVIRAPSYGGNIPHLDFSLDKPNPTDIYRPYSTAIGPLDVERVNAMCIVEFPNWSDCQPKESTDKYGSIGEFYESVRNGASILADCIQGNHRQVEHFNAFYPEVTTLTITENGQQGLSQVNNLIDLIVDQGEGQNINHQYVNAAFQNHVDDLQPTWDHFKKFSYLREQPLPETFSIGFGNKRGREVQAILLKNFGELLVMMNAMFRGKEILEFAPTMFKVGASIAACWENGVLPVFSKPNDSLGE